MNTRLISKFQVRFKISADIAGLVQMVTGRKWLFLWISDRSVLAVTVGFLWPDLGCHTLSVFWDVLATACLDSLRDASRYPGNPYLPRAALVLRTLQEGIFAKGCSVLCCKSHSRSITFFTPHPTPRCVLRLGGASVSENPPSACG